MKNTSLTKYILTVSGILLTTIQVHAQKLPARQEVSLHTPTDVKIDGKYNEVNNFFAAHNPATGLSYSLTNDDKRIYLILQAPNPDEINRVIMGGITFTVKNKLDKNAVGVSITYPVKNGKNISFVLTPRRGQVLDTSPNGLDSTMKANNKRLDDAFKLIKVTGISDLDTISIYNQEEIRAAGRFDVNKLYTVEMSVPLKYLSNEIGQTNKFTYQIRVNGSAPLAITIGAVVGAADPAAAERAQQSMQTALETLNAKRAAVTSFTADYDLAK